jgi:hypothetical protein
MGGRAQKGQQAKKSAASKNITPEQALDTLLHYYMDRRDWFMVERLAHDLDRINEGSESEQED